MERIYFYRCSQGICFNDIQSAIIPTKDSFNQFPNIQHHSGNKLETNQTNPFTVRLSLTHFLFSESKFSIFHLCFLVNNGFTSTFDSDSTLEYLFSFFYNAKVNPDLKGRQLASLSLKTKPRISNFESNLQLS